MRRASVGLVVAVLVVSATACGGDDTSDETLPTLAPTTVASTEVTPTDVVPTEAPPSTEAPTPTEPPATEAPVVTEAPTDTIGAVGSPTFVIVADVEGGEPVGGVRSYLVEVGQTVEITVTSDTADEAHLHGYDLDADLSPGVPATITFTADMDGSFEMELHGSGALLFYLDVV